MLARAWRKFLFRWRREWLWRELAEEIESHRLLAAGNRAMGNIALAQEDCHQMWSFIRLENILKDVRFGVRIFARAPGFTAVAVLSLAIGTGGMAAIFSLVDALLVRPLPYRAPEGLVRLTVTYPRAAVAMFRERSRTMEIAAASDPADYNLTTGGEPVRVAGSAVSANLFSLLGAAVARGRTFAPGEDSPGRDAVVIISDSLWRNRFGGEAPAVRR